jgi:glyoxylase-like metal-dependent hydrolase (beta-lactamase superfamily II)
MKGRRARPLIVLLLIAGNSAVMAQARSDRAAARTRAAETQPATPESLTVEHVRGGIYMIAGAGANITVQIGAEGVLLVDSGNESGSEQVIAALRTLTKTPVTQIVNTHYHLDHTGGNVAIAASGRNIGASRSVQNSASIWAHENTLTRLSAPTADGTTLLPTEGWPIDSFFNELQDIFFNGEPVQLLHMPSAHTDGDTVVFFRRSDVIATGDVFSTSRYPMLEEEDGASIDGVIDALNRIIELAVPERNQEGGTMVIPGHGHISDEYDVVIYRDALTIIRDRIDDMIARGMTLQQVKAARPSLDFDAAYGTTEGSWTTDMFIEAVYESRQERRQ